MKPLIQSKIDYHPTDERNAYFVVPESEVKKFREFLKHKGIKILNTRPSLFNILGNEYHLSLREDITQEEGNGLIEEFAKLN